ncbi:MAG TPA: PEP-CTERM sorting domain-containing protein [Gemmatales bacterium]|nr:PEP-CTERM sorting domain-containing protein [Gemmatales bacterium]
MIWTSTTTDTIDISGNTWLGRDIGRGNTWSIWKNGTMLTSGVVTDGDAFNRSNPFLFANGTGGASALQGVSVVPGDIIMFQAVRTTGAGDFIGVNMSITTSAVPEPATIALTSLSAVAFGAYLWCNPRRRKTRVAKAK